MPLAYAQTAPAPAAGDATKKKAVKDQGEYDILTAAQKEPDPAKKLVLLKQWADKYPDSDFKSERLLAVMQANNQIASGALAQTKPTPEQLTAAQTAAQALLDNLQTAFSPEAKPATVSDADWTKARTAIEQQAHTTLGWVAMQNKNYPESEAQYKQALGINGDMAQLSYWLGSVILLQKDLNRTPEALYEFARAASVTGPGALTPEGKKAADDYLKKAYVNWHGDETGLPDLKTQVASAALPPAGFRIKSVVDIQKEENLSEADFNAKHPDVALWRNLKAAVIADNGSEYFNTKVKDTEIPTEFKGRLISATPEAGPKELQVAIDGNTADAVLVFETPLKGQADPGTMLSFKGVPKSFQKEPYQMTFEVAKSDLKGWPVPQTPEKPAVRKRPVTRKR